METRPPSPVSPAAPAAPAARLGGRPRAEALARESEKVEAVLAALALVDDSIEVLPKKWRWLRLNIQRTANSLGSSFVGGMLLVAVREFQSRLDALNSAGQYGDHIAEVLELGGQVAELVGVYIGADPANNIDNARDWHKFVKRSGGWVKFGHDSSPVIEGAVTPGDIISENGAPSSPGAPGSLAGEDAPAAVSFSDKGVVGSDLVDLGLLVGDERVDADDFGFEGIEGGESAVEVGEVDPEGVMRSINTRLLRILEDATNLRKKLERETSGGKSHGGVDFGHENVPSVGGGPGASGSPMVPTVAVQGAPIPSGAPDSSQASAGSLVVDAGLCPTLGPEPEVAL